MQIFEAYVLENSHDVIQAQQSGLLGAPVNGYYHQCGECGEELSERMVVLLDPDTELSITHCRTCPMPI